MNLCLATVIGLGSRELAGWQIADHMRTELVEDALRVVAHDCGSLAGIVFHSDHGSVYTLKGYAELCERQKATQSMGVEGSSADNALALTLAATLKRELLEGATPFPARPPYIEPCFAGRTVTTPDGATPQHGSHRRGTPWETAWA